MPPLRADHLALVAAGGALGSVARYLVSLAVSAPGFPLATLLVNLAGSALIGAFLPLAGARDDARLFVATGLLGGFTTLSTFSYETVAAMQRGAWGIAATNILVTVIGGIAACAGGHAVGSWFMR